MKHFKILNLNAGNKQSRTLDPGRYYGFAVGADGVHGEFSVDFNGETHIVKLGAPVVLARGGETGTPVVTALRVLQRGYDAAYIEDTVTKLPAFSGQAHVMAFECCEEIGYQVPMKLRDIVDGWDLDSDGESNPSDDLMAVLPFAGRESCLLNFDGDPGNIKIYGATMELGSLTGRSEALETPTYKYELFDTAHTSGTIDIVTQDVGAYDQLALYLGDGTAAICTLHVRII